MNRVGALVYYDGKIKKKRGEGVVFRSKNTSFVYFHNNCSFADLTGEIRRQLRLEAGDQIALITYRMPISSGSVIQYSCFHINNDEDMSVMVDCHGMFSEVKIIELYVQLVRGPGSEENVERPREDVGPSYTVHRGNPPHGREYVNEVEAGVNLDSVDDIYVASSDSSEDNDDDNADVGCGRRTGSGRGSVSGSRVNIVGASGSGSGYRRGSGSAGRNSVVGGRSAGGSGHRGACGSGHGGASGSGHGGASGSGHGGVRGNDYDGDDHGGYGGCFDHDVGVGIVQSVRADIPMPLPFDLNEYYIPPPHMVSIDLNEMAVPEFPEYGLSSFGDQITDSTADMDLRVGVSFPNKEAVKLALKHYSILRNVAYKVVESDQSRYVARCVHRDDGCEWGVRVSFKKRKNGWVIAKYNGSHTCTVSRTGTDHPMLDSEYVCSCIIPLVQADASISAEVIRAEINKTYKFMISYKKAWKAKQKAIRKIYGDFNQSYQELPRFILSLKQAMPGTRVELQTGPFVDAENVPIDDHLTFQRMFWTFEPLIEAFNWCKPVIQIDGTHLYGKYKGVLMMAIIQDGNQNILPIAFCIAEGENNSSWRFFLRNLRTHVTPREGICIISDRHPSIKNALEYLEWSEPAAFHRYCVRHVAANFMRKFPDSEAKEYLVNAGL